MAKIAGAPSRKKSGSRFGQAPSAAIVDLSLAAVAKNASVVWEKDDSGKITDLKLRWPTPNGLAATQEIKISYWLEFPLLSAADRRCAANLGRRQNGTDTNQCYRGIAHSLFPLFPGNVEP
jgi:hypothetical protein